MASSQSDPDTYMKKEANFVVVSDNFLSSSLILIIERVNCLINNDLETIPILDISRRRGWMSVQWTTTLFFYFTIRNYNSVKFYDDYRTIILLTLLFSRRLAITEKNRLSRLLPT